MTIPYDLLISALIAIVSSAATFGSISSRVKTIEEELKNVRKRLHDLTTEVGQQPLRTIELLHDLGQDAHKS